MTRASVNRLAHVIPEGGQCIRSGSHQCHLPGFIDAPLWENSLAEESDPETTGQLKRENQPLRRRVTPIDIAQQSDC